VIMLTFTARRRISTLRVVLEKTHTGYGEGIDTDKFDASDECILITTMSGGEIYTNRGKCADLSNIFNSLEKRIRSNHDFCDLKDF